MEHLGKLDGIRIIVNLDISGNHDQNGVVTGRMHIQRLDLVAALLKRECGKLIDNARDSLEALAFKGKQRLFAIQTLQVGPVRVENRVVMPHEGLANLVHVSHCPASLNNLRFRKARLQSIQPPPI